MLKLLLLFAVFVFGMLLLLVYFVGSYNLNTDYLTATIRGRVPAERNLLTDDGSKGKSFYHLSVTTRGMVDFKKDDGVNRDFRSFKIEDKDLETIRSEMNQTDIFKIFTLDRTYCFDKYDANMSFNFGWISKSVKYSNCKDDPSEVKDFRHFLYDFLGLSLQGT